MKCEKLLEAMNEYVDGTIDPGICESLQKHLDDCDPCQVVIDNIRQTITLFKAGVPYELPIQFKAKLRDELRRRWKARFPKGQKRA
ncbi:MAG: zf-HC2 domain-containing protein [Candidatus Riflebacteria bacterium]|nr:zf-HC2 domain-containing protein [Candidatus Riflebacteria bacterium]